MARSYAITAEQRAEAMSKPGVSLSGNSYIRVIMRGDGKPGAVPFVRDSSKCDHGVSMCPSWECVESWSVDHQVMLSRTNAGRVLAELMDVDPEKVSTMQRSGIERHDIENYRYDVDSTPEV